jgi:predicted house-cleaning noncanonical NTP pyrophosphatase (MazG superfamily)
MKYDKCVVYDKLVRDKIPEIIRKNGAIPFTHVASDEEYLRRLEDKLEEEVGEFLSSSDVGELADILEVVYALCDFHGFDKDKLESIRRDKVVSRGGFNNRIVLDRTE